MNIARVDDISFWFLGIKANLGIALKEIKTTVDKEILDKVRATRQIGQKKGVCKVTKRGNMYTVDVETDGISVDKGAILKNVQKKITGAYGRGRN